MKHATNIEIYNAMQSKLCIVTPLHGQCQSQSQSNVAVLSHYCHHNKIRTVAWTHAGLEGIKPIVHSFQENLAFR